MTDTDLLDRASTLVPTLRLEVADVIAAGRRRRRDRAARVVGACAAVLLVAVVAADRLPFPTGQPAAGADFGTGPSVELAPGIRATRE